MSFPLQFTKTPHHGFTLIELLVALAIFAIIATVAYSSLQSILTTYSETNRHVKQITQLQLAFTYLKRDLTQYINRSIRDEYGDQQPALKGFPQRLTLTRIGWRNPLYQQRSTLQRLNYHVEEGILWRSYWHVLDRAQDSDAEKIALLEQVDNLQFRYLDDQLKWHDEWRSTIQAALPIIEKEKQTLRTLKAIEVNLTLKQQGTLRWLFQVIE